MAFGYDGSVRIKADLNHSNFDRGLVSMTNKVQSFGKTLTKLAGLVGLAFGTAALVNFGKESIKLASDIEEVQNVIDVTFGRGAAQIEEFAQSAATAFGLSELSAKQYTGTMGAMLKSSGLVTGQAQEMSLALTGLAGDIASFYNLDTDTAFEKIRSGISGETEPLKQLGINMSVANLEAYALSKGITKSYNAMSQAEQVLLRYNYLLSVTTDAQGDFARTSGSFANQIRILQLNFDQLRIAMGNALIPIAQAVLPSINAIIAGLTKLAKVFAQVTALLFGKSAEVKATSGVASSAGAAADATDKLAESTAGAGEAAKKAEKDMKGVLASFDELNIIAGKTADSVGGAAGGIDAGASDFEIPSYESEIEDANQLEEAFSSLGELFIATLDKMLAAMPEFKQALLDFAENFNEFNQKLYDAFTFPGVLDRVKQLGVELADAFNGLVNAIDWELWGRTLGAGLNLGLNFLTSFIYEFDWINLGNKLAEFINGLVYEIDWYEFGRLLWAKFKLGLEVFAGFITGLDMPALAQAASDIIMGFFDSMQETLANIDWEEIGRQVARFLNNIDWMGVIKSISGALREMVGAAISAIGGFISEADTGTLIAAALFFGSKLVSGLIKSVIAPVAKEIGSSLIKKVAESVTATGAGGLASTIGSAIAKMGPLLISVGIGLTLIIKAIKDIVNDGINIGNALVGALGGAAAGAGIGFTIGGPAGVAIGAVIGVGLTLSLEGVVAQITGGVDLFGAIATVLGTTLAGAGIGFAVGNLPGAMVGAIIGLAAGIVLEITGVKAAGESAYKATEDFQVMKDVLDECEASSKRSSDAMMNLSKNVDNLSVSLSDVGAAQSLVDEIYAINENASASSYELELMATKVELLNGLGLDGLQLTIDETTGRIVETKEATDQLIASIQREAEAAALQELLVQAYKDRYQAVSDAEQAVKSVTVAEQALRETEEQLTNTPWWDLDKHAALTAQQEKQTEALEAATEARNEAVTAYDELSGAIDTYSGALTNLSEPESSVGVELESRIDSVRQTVEAVAADMPGYGRNISDGLNNGMDEGITEEKTKGIFGKIGDFFKDLFGIHSPSTVFSDFGGFLMAGLHNGLNDNLSPITELFSTLWRDIQKGSEDTWVDVQGEWNPAGSWFDENVVKPISGFFSGLWSGIGKAASDAWADIKRTFSNVGSWFSSNVTSKFPSGGRMAYSTQSADIAVAGYALPRLANGAVIPPNQQFAAILGDQRSGKNLEAPANLIRQMVAEGIQAAGGVGRSGGNMTIIMEIDGREFGRASYKYGTAEQQRVGVRLAEVRT